MKFLQNCKCHQRNSKRGGMLVLVLIIFAVSLILISSAMTITLASRSRYYVNTERSQERLTLSCAAEAVIDAIETQELTDTKLKSMVGASQPYQITGASSMLNSSGPSATDGKDIAPGLAGQDVSKTFFRVEAVPDSEDLDLIFSTLIDVTGEDSKTENLRVRMKYTPPSDPIQICSNMVTCGDETSTDIVDIQMLYVNTNKSYTVLHGNVTVTAAGETYIKNPCVFTGNVTGGQGTKYYNDMIFYGPNAGINTQTSGNGVKIEEGYGDFYFLGVNYGGESGTQQVFRNNAGQGVDATGFNVIADGAYFYKANAKLNDWTMGGSYTKYWVVGSGSTVTRTNDWAGNVVIEDTGSASIATSGAGNSNKKYSSPSDVTDADTQAAYDRLSSKAAAYMNDPKLKSAAEHHVLTSEEADSAFGSYKKGDMLSSAAYSNRNTVIDGGKAYKMSGTYSDGSIEVDLTKGTASIYITGDVTFNAFHIKCSNATGNQLIILMAEGTKLKMGTVKHWENKITGILSVDVRNSTNFSEPYGNNLKGMSGEKPACMIVGLGSNEFFAGQANVVDAYISLAGKGEQASTVRLQNGPHFYGRFEAAKYEYTNGDPIKLDYCPNMDEDDGHPKPLISSYSAESYEYFYT